MPSSKTRLKLVATVFLLLVPTAEMFAQTPDPRDSLIIESKIVAPGQAAGPSSDTASYVRFRVWITNKDTLAAVLIPLLETSVSGGAYAMLAYPRNANGVLNRLTSTLSTVVVSANPYHGNSPDSAVLAAFSSTPTPDAQNMEPPNSIRKALWEIKFDSVLSNLGTFELDTVNHILGTYPEFVDISGSSHRYNFVKSVVTVCLKGDLNCDGDQRVEDVVMMLQCVFVGTGNCDATMTDLNCDGAATSSDIVVELNKVFLGTPIACP